MKRQEPTKKKEVKAVLPARQPLVPRASLLPFLFILLYAAVDLVPRLDGGDVMGSQWVYLTIINLLGVVYILLKKTDTTAVAVKRISRNILSLFYLAILVWAGLSIFFSINRIEAVVVYARLINSVIMYFNLAILLYGHLHLLKPFAYILSFLLLIQSISTLSAFYRGIDETDITSVIYNLKGNAGNKNILAASLMTKMAFTLYCIYISGIWGKLIHSAIALVAAIAIFLLNARASYIGVILIVLLYIAIAIIFYYKKTNTRPLFHQLAGPPLAIGLAFFISQAIFKNALNMQDKATGYGTVTSRLSSISFTAEGSNARLFQWTSALDYIKQNPLKGSGYGNWKLVSIPYEKTYVDDFYVTYHVHNDFLEMTTELGLPGGLLFLGLFLFTFLYALKGIFSPLASIKTISLLVLMALAAYFIDAFFNFPMERPVMQFFFAFILALGVNIFLATKTEEQKTVTARPASKFIFGALGIAFLLPALYITSLTYQSFVVQTKVNKDMSYEQPATKWQEIIDAFPPIPNMNAYCFPVDQIKAFYLMQDKKYDEALTLLNSSAHINPYLPLPEFFKAKIYLATGKLDSAFYFAYTTFFSKPRVKSSYEVLNEISSKKGDTATLTKAFKEYTKYRNEPWAWNRYLDIMMYMPSNRDSLLALANRGATLFPNDPDLQQKKIQLQNAQQAPAFTAQQQADFLKYFNIGTDFYIKQNYPAAIRNFTLASQSNPNDFISVENIGLSYFAQNNFTAALPFLDKVIASKATQDGKSEYYKGLALLNLGRKTEGCRFLRMADGKNYPPAKASIAANCNTN